MSGDENEEEPSPPKFVICVRHCWCLMLILINLIGGLKISRGSSSQRRGHQLVLKLISLLVIVPVIFMTVRSFRFMLV